LIELLTDWASNSDYDYVIKLFHQYCENVLGSCNEKLMFEKLANIINDYNALNWERAIMQEYNIWIERSYILYIVTSLICQVYKKVLQAGKVLPLYLFIIIIQLYKIFFNKNIFHNTYRRTVLYGCLSYFWTL